MNIVQKENMSLMQREDGYVNATALCKDSNKRLNNYLRNEQTQSFLDELSAVTLISATDLIQSQQGGVPSEQGTYVHPKVAIHLAQWLSPKFAVFVTEVIFDFINGVKPPVKELWADCITKKPAVYTPFPREWAGHMKRFYNNSPTPVRLLEKIYDKALGAGAGKKLSQLKNGKKTPMYCYLTDEGRAKLQICINELLAHAETCVSKYEFEKFFEDALLESSV